MSILLNAYPGDAFVESCVVVLLAASLVSLAALLGCRRLKHNPSLRHCVLLSALTCVLLSPLPAFFFTWSDTAIVSIALPVQAVDSTSSRGGSSSSRAGRETVDPPAEPPDEPREAAPAMEQVAPSTGLNADRNPSEAEIQRPIAAPQTASPGDPLRIAALFAFVIWGVGSVVLLFRTARGWNHWRAVARSSRPVEDAQLVGLLQEVRRILHTARLPAIHSSPQVDTPLVLGLWRPLVVLPTRSLREVSENQLRDALVHEISHVLRRDQLVVILQTIARIIFWPNPLIHRLNRQLDRAREEVCDNYVLADRDPIDYGETLLRFAELAGTGRPVPGTIGMLQWRGKLEDRISAMLNDRRNTTTRPRRLAASVVLVAFAVTCAIACGSRFVAAQAEQHRVNLTLGSAKEILAPPGSATAGSKWIQVEVAYSNAGTSSVWVYGHSKKTPFYAIHTRPDESEKWSDYGILFDGIPRLLEIRSGSKHSFTIALPARYRGSEIRVLLDYYTDKSAKVRRRATSAPTLLAVAADQRYPFRTEGPDGKWGYINGDGAVVVEPVYRRAGDFVDGRARVTASEKTGYIDEAGAWVFALPDGCAATRPFSEGLAGFSVGDGYSGKWGYFDRNGNIVVEPKYDEVGDFVQERARVNLGAQWEFPGTWVGGAWGFIDKTGRVVIPIEFDGVDDFADGHARVNRDGKSFHIDRQGRQVRDPIHHRAPDQKRALPAQVVRTADGRLRETNDREPFRGALARVHIGGSFEVADDGPAEWRGGAWYYVSRRGEIVRRVCNDEEGHAAGDGRPSTASRNADDKARDEALKSLQAKGVNVRAQGDGFLCSFSEHADGIELLPELGDVRILKLNSTDVSDDQFQVVSQLRGLESLYIQDTDRLTDRAFTHLAGLKHLQVIAADGNDQLTDAALRELRPLTQLRDLTLVDNTRITDQGLSHLRGMKQLENLEIGTSPGWSETTFFSPSLKISSGLQPNTERIDVTDAGLRHLSGLTELLFLRLSGTKISDAGLAQLQQLKQLRTLDLSHTDITKAGIEQLRGCSQLEWLKLNLCFAIDDKALEQVANFGKLDELDLFGARLVSDAGIEHLTALPLKSLDLRYTNVSDSAIVHLKEMKNLKTLDISDTKITEKGQQELEAALPDCDVRR